MSDPVTHEIDLDEVERAWEEYGGCSDAMVAHYVPGLIARLREAEASAEAAEAERDALRGILDAPDPADFMRATEIEARYQRAHWGSAHDGCKTDADWFWLIGYLAGKALHNPGDDERKRLHRITTVAAAACNWHAARSAEEPRDAATSSLSPSDGEG